MLREIGGVSKLKTVTNRPNCRRNCLAILVSELLQLRFVAFSHQTLNAPQNMGGGGGRLSELLAAAIPSSHPHKYRVHYLLSPPSKHEPLYPSQQPPKSPQKHKSSKSPSHTTCQHHLLLLSYESTFIYAIEVLIYRSKAPPIIYVSKADTTGYGPASITRQITTAFLSYLLQYCGGGTIQLFARSQR